jgi:triphosphoribosyl-dephospho-CoA synthase
MPLRSPRTLARLAVRALWQELALHPKPGLVSLHDTGAHADMDARTFVRSLFALRRYYAAFAAAGARGAPFATLRAIGIEAEAAMLAATGGVNTHRGAIFALGLLVAAIAELDARRYPPEDAAIRAVLRTNWGAALDAHAPATGVLSHGAQACRRHGAGGARHQAARAFPAVFDVALPALREARQRGATAQHARIAALFALFAAVDDTNVLHRGGAAGLAFVQACARGFRGAADPLAYARATHRAFVARGLSPGGSADLLAAALLVDSVQSTRR